MRIIGAILILLAITACASSRHWTVTHIKGTYQWHGIYGVGATMVLKEDRTFEYHWQAGLTLGTTQGTWELEGSKIILNSELQPSKNRFETYELLKAVKRQSDTLSISVIRQDSMSIPFANCVLKQASTSIIDTTTDFEGHARVPKLEADSLIISYIGFKTIRHRLDNEVSEYVFKMQEVNQYYKYFTNEVWTYKRGRLYQPTVQKHTRPRKNY